MRELEEAGRSEQRRGLVNKATDALASKLGVTQSNIDVIEDVPGQGGAVKARLNARTGCTNPNHP